MTLSRDALITAIWSDYNSARNSSDQAQTRHNAVDWTPATDTHWRATAPDIEYILQKLIDTVKSLIDFDLTDYTRWFAIPEYLNEYAASVTWESIVAAWSGADTLGRLWTTLSIDFMRKEVWNEPVTSFQLRSGAAGE